MVRMADWLEDAPYCFLAMTSLASYLATETLHAREQLDAHLRQLHVLLDDTTPDPRGGQRRCIQHTDRTA